MTLPQLSMVREERRFLMQDVQAVIDLLQQRGNLNSYQTQTYYVDTPEGTWSKDAAKPRFRLRRYNGADTFLEVKLHIPGTRAYVKKRNKADGIPDGMVTLGISLYGRREWEQGDVRVTLDDHVTTSGKAGARRLPGFVVETKLPVGAPLPNWLRLLKPYEQDFSKWSWVSG